jgi:hypothetical protein
MSLDFGTNCVCQQLKDDYGVLAQIIRGKNKAVNAVLQIDDKINKMRREMQNTIFSPANAVEDAISEMNNAIKGGLPDPSDIDAMIRVIKACTYFDNIDNPVAGAMSMLDKLSNSLINDISKYANALADSVPEFSLMNLIDEIRHQFFKDRGLSELMATLDKIIECLNAICGPTYVDDVADMIAEVTEARQGMKMTESGDFNWEEVCQEAGLTPEQTTDNISSVVNASATLRDDIKTTITDCSTSVSEKYFDVTIPGI